VSILISRDNPYLQELFSLAKYRILYNSLYLKNLMFGKLISTVGYADPKTTSCYDRRPERTKQDAANKLHFPYTKKGLG